MGSLGDGGKVREVTKEEWRCVSGGGNRRGEAITKPMRRSGEVVMSTLATIVECVVKLPVLVPVRFPSHPFFGRVLAACSIRHFVGLACCHGRPAALLCVVILRC